MIKKLIKLANHLDKKGFTKEADYLDNLIKKASDSNKEKSMREKIEDLRPRELNALSMHTGKNYKEQFEGDLIQLVSRLVPNISDKAVDEIIENSTKYQKDLEDMIEEGHSVMTKTMDFLESVALAAKKL